MTRLEVAFKLAKSVANYQLEIEHYKNYLDYAKQINDDEHIQHCNIVINNLTMYIIGIRDTSIHFNMSNHDIMRIADFLRRQLKDSQKIREYSFKEFKESYDLKRI